APTRGEQGGNMGPRHGRRSLDGTGRTGRTSRSRTHMESVGPPRRVQGPSPTCPPPNALLGRGGRSRRDVANKTAAPQKRRSMMATSKDEAMPKAADQIGRAA